MMENPRHAQERVLIERAAERAALFQIRGESFTQCLRLNHLATEWSVVTENGKQVTLRGQDLVHTPTWTSFLSQHEVTFSWLSYTGAALAVTYAQWLRTSHTARYRALSTQEDIAWLRQVARLAVLWHLMLHKHAEHTFLDPWVESEMGKVLLVRDFCREMARAVNHGIKEPGQATALLEQAYQRCVSLIEDRTFAAYEAGVVLPPGIPDPLALPEEKPSHE